MRRGEPRLLTKREIFRPTWWRVVFTLIPLAYGAIWWLITSEYNSFIEVPNLLRFPAAILIVAIFFLTQFLVMPFWLILEPIGLGESWGLWGRGLIVVVIGYMLIFYFLFPTWKIFRGELRRMFERKAKQKR